MSFRATKLHRQATEALAKFSGGLRSISVADCEDVGEEACASLGRCYALEEVDMYVPSSAYLCLHGERERKAFRDQNSTVEVAEVDILVRVRVQIKLPKNEWQGLLSMCCSFSCVSSFNLWPL